MGTQKGETKELVVVQIGNLYRIKYEGGGEVPAALDGLFTSPEIAQSAIAGYQTVKEQKA